MGWDIVFQASFANADSPASRFAGIWRALGLRAEFRELAAFEILDKGYPLRPPVAALKSWQLGAPEVPGEQVTALLREHDSRDVAFRGTWRTEGARAGAPTRGAVTITAFGTDLRPYSKTPRPIDVTWDIGDSRRYTPKGVAPFPNVDQVMTELALLAELGADSIWGLDPDGPVSPDHLYAVFHRNANHYRGDGIARPFPDLPIEVEHVTIAANVRPCHHMIQTPAGPIVYHEALGAGRLNVFYAALEGALQADAEEGTFSSGSRQ